MWLRSSTSQLIANIELLLVRRSPWLCVALRRSSLAEVGLVTAEPAGAGKEGGNVTSHQSFVFQCGNERGHVFTGCSIWEVVVDNGCFGVPRSGNPASPKRFAAARAPVLTLVLAKRFAVARRRRVAKAYCGLVKWLLLKWLNNSLITSYQLPNV